MTTAITREYLLNNTWSFYHKNGPVASNVFRFLPDGKIGGYVHQNEHSWHMENGIVALNNEAGQVTVRFNSVTNDGGKITLSGSHIPAPGIILCLTEQRDKFPRFPGTKSLLQKEIALHGWKIGDHTYGQPLFIEPGQSKLTIGKYTSIAGEVHIAFGNHRTDIVSTYPFSSLRSYWPNVPTNVPDHTTKGDIIIGNDVWIGNGALILSGVTVGNGAVIGARAVVAKDVPPYAIVVGNPSRIVRYRFAPHVIDRLLELGWWDWPDEVVDSYLPLMMSSDIEAFLDHAAADPAIQNLVRP